MFKPRYIVTLSYVTWLCNVEVLSVFYPCILEKCPFASKPSIRKQSATCHILHVLIAVLYITTYSDTELYTVTIG